MSIHASATGFRRPSLPHLRWWIGGMLFASTVINYIDRQSLSVLAPFLKSDYHWNNQQFASLVIVFRVAYAVGQAITGRAVDRLGTRNALSLSVLWYSITAIFTPLANGLVSLCFFRFSLGLGESANWPAATKAVSEWFPPKERGWAVALFDSGSSIGAAVAPLVVLGVYQTWGSWRPAVMLPGLLGLVWVVIWRFIYRSPDEHPRLDERERFASDSPPVTWVSLLRLRQTWGILLGRSLTDPVWFFIADWFAIYISSKQVHLQEAILSFWIPFLAADVGNFAGGGISSLLIGRGWNVVKARKAVIVVCGFGMTMLIGAVFTANLHAIIALFSVATCCYAAWSTMALTLPSDLYPSAWVASVSGISGGGSGLGTIVSTFLIGWTADRYSFEPVLIVASLIPLIATALLLWLVGDSRPLKAA